MNHLAVHDDGPIHDEVDGGDAVHISHEHALDIFEHHDARRAEGSAQKLHDVQEDEARLLDGGDSEAARKWQAYAKDPSLHPCTCYSGQSYGHCCRMQLRGQHAPVSKSFVARSAAEKRQLKKRAAQATTRNRRVGVPY